MVNPDDVIFLYEELTNLGIRIWLTGGWGIDALLGEHIRPHKDLDVIMLVDDVNRMTTFLGKHGYQLKELWSENLQTTNSFGEETATAFVLRDTDGHELDAHAMRLDAHGTGRPAWQIQPGFLFTPQDMAGMGLVKGIEVHCVSAENQMTCHTGYTLPDYQWEDLQRLSERYGIDYPAEILRQPLIQHQK